MRGFWVPIGLRALAIFVVGFVLVTGARHAIHAANDHGPEDALHHALLATEHAAAAASAGAEQAAAAAEGAHVAHLMATMPGVRGLSRFVTEAVTKATSQPFVLDGRPIGTLQRVVMHRPKVDTPLEFRLTVRLDEGAAAAGCDVAPVSESDFQIEGGFRCADGTATARVGEVRFEPAGVSRAIKVSAAKAQELARGEAIEVDAALDGKGGIAVRKDGQDKVRIVPGPDGATTIIASESGKTVRINTQGSSVSVSVDSTGAR